MRNPVKKGTEPDKVRNVQMGVWIDDPPKFVLRDRAYPYLKKLNRSGFTEIAVMIDDMHQRWKPTWSMNQIEELAETCNALKMTMALTTWPYPHRTSLKKMYEDLDKYIAIAPEVIIADESDTEMNWKGHKVKGFRNLDVAGDYLVEYKQNLKSKYKTRMEQTTFAGHSEIGSKADVSPEMDLVLVQSYSVRTRRRYNRKIKKTETWKVPWEHLYGPNRMQKHSLKKALAIPGIDDGQPKIGVGLAGWNQKWPGFQIKDALFAAFHGALKSTPAFKLEVNHLRIWSSKWLIGVRARSDKMINELNHVISMMNCSFIHYGFNRKEVVQIVGLVP